MIRKSARTITKTTLKRQKMSRGKRSAISKMARTTKRYGKQTLRDILLSKTFNSSFKVLVGFVIVGSALYGAYTYVGKTFGNDIVVSKSEIISRVAKLVPLPKENPQDIKRVQNGEGLKIQNPLFENIKEGDYIIIYPTLAIVYDLRNDAIVAMKKTGGR